MADLTARRDSLLDYLPGDWQQAINTSSVVNALSRMINRPTPNLERGIEHDQYGNVADRNWLLEQARGGPPKMHPLAAEMLDKGGLLANFLGPGVKLPGVPRAPGRYAMDYPGGRIDYKDMDGGVHVSGIYTNPEARGQGNAKQALQELIAAADAAKRPMSLEISPGAPGVDPARLRQWYESLGFSGPDYAMTRPPPPTGIRAYHGSPHDFDRFDMSKIGTGEGAQAYGRGLYFAENEGVARSYRDALGGRGVVSPYAQSVLSVANGDYDAAIKAISARIDNPGAFPLGTGELQQARKAISDLTQARDAGVRLGRMYEVNIKADPEQFLDWDKPLSQQPEGVLKKLAPILDARRIDQERTRAIQAKTFKNGPVSPEFDPSDYTGAMFARDSQALRDAGIPGIKYLDQGSRTAGQGSRNFVVFDDALVEILRKYGLLPPVAAGTAAALNEQEPQQ